MSEDSETATRRIAREASAPGAWVLALAALMGGGGLGSLATGTSTATQVQALVVELRETRAQLVGEVRRVSDKIDAEATKTSDHATRLRNLESLGLPRRIEEIERRLQALEGRPR